MSVVDCSAKSDRGNVEKMKTRCSVRGGVCDLEITIWAKPNTGTSARVRPDQEGPPGEKIGYMNKTLPDDQEVVRACKQ